MCPQYQTAAELEASLSKDAASQKSALDYRDEGLQAFAAQHLRVARTADAITDVAVFRDVDGARRAVASFPSNGGGAQARAFAVPGVPGALGVDFVNKGQLVGRNVEFQVGPYAYTLGFAPADSQSAQQPSERATADAAAAWYRKVQQLSS